MNVASAIYGLILAASVITAADSETGDSAGGVAAFTLVTLIVFWVAHSYSEILGAWSASGITPKGSLIWSALGREWPMVVAPILPLAMLAIGGFGFVSDQTAIDLASGLCVAELGVTSYFAARRGGAGLLLALIATVASALFGVSIILLKLLLH